MHIASAVLLDIELKIWKHVIIILKKRRKNNKYFLFFVWQFKNSLLLRPLYIPAQQGI